MTETALRGQHSIAAIRDMPAAARRRLDGGGSQADAAARLLERAAGEGRVFLVGTGTSYHAAHFGEHLLRAVGVDAWAVRSVDFVQYPRPLRATDGVVVFSHRGSKQYSVQALELAHARGLPTVLVTALESRYRGEAAGAVLPVVAQERSSMFTVSLTAATVTMAQVAVRLGERLGRTAAALADGLARVPSALDAALAAEPQVERIAEAALAGPGRLFFVGSGPNAATGPEAALKAKEGAYVTAEGMDLEQFIHGPLVGVEPEDLVAFVSPTGPNRPRAVDLLRALGHVGASTWFLGDEPPDGATHTTALAALPEVLSPIVALTPLNLLAYHLAMRRGTDPDRFRQEHERYARAVQSLVL